MRSLTLQLSNLAYRHLWKCSTRHRTKMFLREPSRHNGVGPVRERFLMMIPASLVSIDLIETCGGKATQGANSAGIVIA